MKIIKIVIIIIILLGLLWILKPIILLYLTQDKEPIYNTTYISPPTNYEIENGALKDDFEYVSSYEKKLYRHKKSTTKNTHPSVFSCDGRQHCSQMHSYEEAKYFINHCPHTKMDGDHDGIPCERQFRKYN